MSVTVTKDKVAALLKSIQGLEGKQALVGVPAANAGRDPDPEDPQPINNAALAYIHDNGSPAANIPERPFTRPGIESVQDQIADRYKKGARAVLDGRVSDMDVVHDAVGQIAEDAIKRKITDGPFTPLAPATIAKRKARGRKSEKPLIDSAQMRNAITHVVRPKRR